MTARSIAIKMVYIVVPISRKKCSLAISLYLTKFTS